MAREIIVVPYDESWPLQYEMEKAFLKNIFDCLIIDIQHFGSTSVKGMTAKPTIDVMVVVKRIEEVDRFNNEMIRCGYTPRGENMIPGRRYFIRFKEDGVNHAAHIHIYGEGNPHIIDELMFRDFLGIDRESFIMYESVKKEVSDKYRFSPREYQNAKYNCVMEIMKKAKQYYDI